MPQYLSQDHSVLALGINLSKSFREKFPGSILLIGNELCTTKFISVCQKLEKSYFLVDSSFANFKGQGRIILSLVGGIDYFIVDSSSINQGLLCSLDQIGKLSSFCFFTNYIGMDQTLAAVSSLRSSNPDIRLCYTMPMGISRCRSAATILKSVLCESETCIVETVKKLSYFSVINNTDKLKSAITFIVSKYNAFQIIMAQSKENNYKGIPSESYFLISESKKEREKLFEMCQENVIPLWGTSEGVKHTEPKSMTEDKIPVFTVATMAPFNAPKMDQTSNFHPLLITSPKNLDDLIYTFGWNQGLTGTLIASHREFNLRRNQLLQEFIDPVGMLKILRILKKNIQHRGIFKLSLTECQSSLGTTKRSSITWLISELSSLGMLDYLGSLPTAVHVEFVGPSSAKMANSAVKELVSKSQFICGKYKACPITLMGLSQDLFDKWKQGSATVLTRDDLKRITSQADRFMELLGEAKKHGTINLEVKDEALLVQFKGELSEVDIQRLIHKRSLFEEETVSQLDALYSILLSSEQLEFQGKGALTKEASPWQQLLQQHFRHTKLDSLKILPELKNNLSIKSINGQRERTSLLQDLNLILRGDKALFKPVVDAAKKHNDSLKRRSIAYFVTKQLFYTSQSSMRLLKSTQGLLSKIHQFDYLEVIATIADNYENLGLE